MKKIITISIIIVLTVAIVGAFSINYIFDKMVGDQILSQLDLESMSDGPEDSIIDGDLEKEIKDVQEVYEEGKEDKENNSNENKDSTKNDSFTDEELEEIQDQFSTIDKLKVMGMLTSKLSMDEIKELSGLSSGEINNKELKNIKSVLKQKLNRNDIEHLKGLYLKYDR